MTVAIVRQPDGNRLGREAPVGEGHDHRPAGAEDASDIGEDLDGSDEVLHADGADDGVERGVVERQTGLTIQVVDHERRELRVVGHLSRAHPQSRHDAEPVGKVRAPRRHEIEHGRARSEDPGVELAQRSDRARLEVHDLPLGRVEVSVVGRVAAGEGVASRHVVDARAMARADARVSSSKSLWRASSPGSGSRRRRSA